MNASPVAIAARAQKQAADPAASAWVSASAGSGKTKVLVDRVLSLLLTGTRPEKILCLTFTKAAAAEMSNRISERLAQWVTASDQELNNVLKLLPVPVDTATEARARRLFAEVIDAPGGLQISTIHAFCQSLLRRFPVEAGIAPHFTLMDERDAAEALQRAQESTLAHARAGGRPDLAGALALVTARVHETNFADLMGNLAASRAKLARMLAAYGGIAGAIAAVCAAVGVDADETEEDLIAAACHDDAFACAALRRVVAAMIGGSKTDQERGRIIASWLESTATRPATFEIYTAAYFTQKGEVRATLATKQVVGVHADALDVLGKEAARLQALIARVKAVRVASATAALLTLGAHLLALYTADKRQHGVMDYDDLIQATRRLLERPGIAAWVLYKLDGGLDHVLIDEAQDTNPDQWAIVQALTAEFFAGIGHHEDRKHSPRTIFAVGDRKQSIYGFQGAAPDEFNRMQALLAKRAADIEQSWRDVNLNVSFRSAPAVLEAVNGVFAQAQARDGLGDMTEDMVHLAAREGTSGLVEIWPLVEPAPADDLPTWKPPVERVSGDSPPHRLAGLIARRIAQMIRTGEQLESQGRAIRAGDIMVLVRRRTGFVEELVRQLKKADIAVAGVDRMVLTEQMAVMDLMALGQFLLLPEDDLTLATVLKGPLVGLSEEELFVLAYGRGPKRLWDVFTAHGGSASRFGDAHAYLAGLLARADFLTPAELFAHVLVTGDGRRKLLARLGMDADDPIDEFMELALGYQRGHVPSLQGFLHWLAAGETEIKRDLEQRESNAVRIITVHGAKGLQAPIVFLPDTTQVPRAPGGLLWSGGDAPLMLWAARVNDLDPITANVRAHAEAAQEREYRRLLYVAMTRAEDRLYVCGWQNRQARKFDQSWYMLVKSGVGGLGRADTVTDAFLAGDGTLPNGDVIRLASRQTAAIEEQPGPMQRGELLPLPDWIDAPAPPEKTPPKPLAPSRALSAEPPVLSPLRDDGRVRFQRGLTIHRLLQSLPELPPAQRRAAAEALLRRPAWRLEPAAQEAIVAETLAVLDDARFAPLFAPGSRAEVPVTGLVGGYAVAGQVDRLAVSATDVWIIDYKTNRPPPVKADAVDNAYIFQMATYRAALRAIYPRHTVHCMLLWTDGPFVMELAPAQLDDALRGAGLF